MKKAVKILIAEDEMELTLERIGIEKLDEPNEKGNGVILHSAKDYILEDRIFNRHNEKMLKINIKDIYYIEADRNYCRIFSQAQEHLHGMTLKNLDEKLPQNHFLRIHRS